MFIFFKLFYCLNFYTDQTDKGDKKNFSKLNNTEYQVVTEEGTERKPLMTHETTEVHLHFVKIVEIHLLLSNINASMYTHRETVSEKLRFIHSCQTQIQDEINTS